MTTAYAERRRAHSRFIEVRGLRYHLLAWGDESLVTAQRPPLVMLHGWMDVAASFQFAVDAMRDDRFIVALDWRGFGRTEWPTTDSYWFPDYLGDLDVALDALFADRPIDLLGHSMGGNVATMYAGVRPARVRRLVNLEGFGMPGSDPQRAPDGYAKWLDELKAPVRLRPYPSLADVAARLQQNNPLLRADRAAWLAPHWSAQGADGQWHVLGDPAHKRRNPVPYQREEVLACWRRITAPVLWVEGDRTTVLRYPREEFEARLTVIGQLTKAVLSPAGHMLHHDQPEALAAALEPFLDA